jgi:GntR family transcriptional regulator/MocR family aminotransferase
MYIKLSLSRDARSTLQTQIVDQLRDQIVAGQLPPEFEMPPTRELALQYDVSRNTVIHAYERLASEGYLVTVKGVRTSVAASTPESCLILKEEVKEPGKIGRPTVRAPIIFTGDALAVPGSSKARPKLDFWPGRPNRGHFPMATWKKLADDALGNAAWKLTEYGDPIGMLALREAIAQHVSVSRGVNCSADAVVITTGAQEAINLIARMLITADTGVVVENPGYGSAAHTFESYGARIRPVPVDRQGLRTSELPGDGISLAYVTPSHQFPTGAPLSTERREELLNWAYRTGAYIVEDDYDSDYNFTGPPLLSLAGADQGQCVIYVGTFSKALGAGVRTGFMIVPPQLIDVARSVKAMTNYGHPWLEQAILESFLRSGAYLRHLRTIRKAYSETLQCLTSNLQARFGQLDIWGTHNGMHVMWLLPEWMGTAAEFKQRLEGHGVHVHTFASGGAYAEGTEYSERAILLGYAALNEREIIKAVDIMAAATPVDGKAVPEIREVIAKV